MAREVAVGFGERMIALHFCISASAPVQKTHSLTVVESWLSSVVFGVALAVPGTIRFRVRLFVGGCADLVPTCDASYMCPSENDRSPIG
jgi:hypothetical protein